MHIALPYKFCYMIFSRENYLEDFKILYVHLLINMSKHLHVVFEYATKMAAVSCWKKKREKKTGIVGTRYRAREI